MLMRQSKVPDRMVIKGSGDFVGRRPGFSECSIRPYLDLRNSNLSFIGGSLSAAGGTRLQLQAGQSLGVKGMDRSSNRFLGALEFCRHLPGGQPCTAGQEDLTTPYGE